MPFPGASSGPGATRRRSAAAPSVAAAAALREFEANLKENPNRSRGLYGAARAAEVAGDRPKAVGYYEKLVALTSKADTPRPEIARAKTFVSGR